VSEPTPVGTADKSVATCHSCGAKNPEYAQFCYSCGAQQAQALAPASVTTAAPNSPIYSGVVLLLMLSLFLLAVAVFDAWQSAMQDGQPAKFIRPAVVGLMAVGLFIAARRSWARSVSPSMASGTSTQSKRQIITVTVTIGTLLLCTAILFGWLIGKNRKHLGALDVDLAQYSAIGGRISKARSEAGDTIADYVRMYESIEPDVVALQSCSSRLIGELRDYDIEFPEYHDQTAKSIANISKTQHRTVLLIKQIGVAKKVKTMESGEQKAAWLGELVPLAQEEDKLDDNTPH
jgi:zinc ribbon protein